jgi:hypothetical protein
MRKARRVAANTAAAEACFAAYWGDLPAWRWWLMVLHPQRAC